MNRVLALVEGQTEQTFVEEVLAPALGIHGVFMTGALIGKPGHKGGVRPYPAVLPEILAALKQDKQRFCTTMFDYYALPTDWPGAMESKSKPPKQGVAILEREIHNDVCQQLGSAFDTNRFRPYLQLHEFEALLFSDPQVLADVLQEPTLSPRLEAVVRECGEPEAIDDDPDTAPSKRIMRLAGHYQKVLHGTIVAKRIGIQKMRGQCPHFAEWLEMLEELA